MPTHDSLGMTRSRSSHSQQRLDDSDIPEIRVKTAYNGQVFITYIDHKITYPMLMTEMKDICGFAQDQVEVSAPCRDVTTLLKCLTQSRI